MSSKSRNLNPFIALGIASLIIVVLLIFFGDAESPKQLSLNRLENLKQEISTFVQQNGRAPTGLPELGLPEEQIQDHIGEPFIYTVENGTIKVLSYGSDKKPGGSFFKRDFWVTIDLPQ